MPLPDERPRQSVANLIGRFEKQKSSSAASVPPPTFPRTSSVSSHRTEESAQEEIKERREWPPKSVGASATSLTPPMPGPGRLSHPSSSIAPLEKEKPVPTPPDPDPSSVPTEDKPFTPPSPTVIIPAQSMPSKAKSPLSIQSKSTIARPASSVKSPASKPMVKSSHATPLKPTASGGSTSSTPLKPQHTGQSTTSISTTPKTAAKRVSATPKPPVATTPSRAKTPLSAVRSKTPSTDIRPKTPSSGLYAPTAASLARSRAGLPAPPPVEKPRRKPTADLSKPTAASASKMRSPTATPPRTGKAPTGKPATTKPVAKPTVGKTATSVRQSGSAKPVVSKPVTSHSKASTAKKTASSGEPPASADMAAPTNVGSSEAAIETPEEQEVEEASNIVVSAVGHAVESEPEDPTEIHESASDEEVSQIYEEQDSLVEEEIENYDEDFPDESPHGTHVEHENGEAATDASEGLDESSVVEEPDQQNDVEPVHANHGTNDHSPVPEEVDNDPEIVEEHDPIPPPTSGGASTDLIPSNDIDLHDGVKESPEEGKTNPTTVGTDLEDIVNLLESGVGARKPSVEVSSGANTVVAGEIPDEY